MKERGIKLELIKIDKALNSLTLSIRLHAAFIKNLLSLEPFKKGYRLGTDKGPILLEEPNLDIHELKIDSHNLQVIALGACSIVLDEALNVFGSKNASSDKAIDKVRCIIFQIRNAYAHNPLDPEWQINRKNHLKVFEIEINNTFISIDMQKVNGQKLKADDFGGISGFYQMVDYVKIQINILGHI